LTHRAVARWTRCLLVTLAGYACSAAPPAAPLAELPLVPYVGRLVTVDVVVQGDTLPFLLDTGGGETLITPWLAEELGCTPAGRAVGFRMTGDRVEFALCPDVTLSFAGYEVTHPDIAVLDLASLLPPDWPDLAGLISLQSFADRPITLELAKRRLILESAESLAERVSGMTPVDLRTATGTDGRSLTVLFRMESPAPGWYLFDSANLDVVRVGTDLGATAVSPPQEGEGATEGPVQFAGLPPVNTRWALADIIYDGVLSEEFIREWTVTLDLSHGRAWVTRAGSREAA
jgi:hypothetical protein